MIQPSEFVVREPMSSVVIDSPVPRRYSERDEDSVDDPHPAEEAQASAVSHPVRQPLQRPLISLFFKTEFEEQRGAHSAPDQQGEYQ